MGKSVSVWYLAAAVFLTIVWWIASEIVQLPIIPSPLLVAENMSDIFMDYIAIHSIYSLWRIASGLLLAVVVGLPLGVIMGYFSKWDRFLSPLVYLTYPIPKIALLPILMLLFGVGESSKIIMIFLIILFQVVVAVRDGIRSIPRETLYPLYSLGARFP